MPTPFEILEAQRREYEAKAAETERDIAELERLLNKYKLTVIAVPEEPIKREPRTVANFTRAAEIAESLVRVAGRPLPTTDMFKQITVDRDMELTGHNPMNIFASYISNRGILRHIKDIGWWFRAIPWPPTSEDLKNLQEDNLPELPLEGRGGRGAGKVGPARSEKNDLIFKTVRELLKERGNGPVRFAELYDILEQRGITMGGKEPRNYLSTYLGKFSCFKNEGRGLGWTYIPERDFSDEYGAWNRQ